jgi:hypothetical protein
MTQTEMAVLIARLSIVLGKLEWEGLHMSAYAVSDAMYYLEDQLLNPTREGM